MLNRFGLALILIGLIALLVFLITFTNEQGDARALLLGASLCALGLILRRRAIRSESRQAADRFRLLHRIRGHEEIDDV